MLFNLYVVSVHAWWIDFIRFLLGCCVFFCFWWMWVSFVPFISFVDSCFILLVALYRMLSPVLWNVCKVHKWFTITKICCPFFRKISDMRAIITFHWIIITNYHDADLVLMLPSMQSNWPNNWSKQIELEFHLSICYVLFRPSSTGNARSKKKSHKQNNQITQIESELLLSQWHLQFYSWLTIWNLVAAPS